MLQKWPLLEMKFLKDETSRNICYTSPLLFLSLMLLLLVFVVGVVVVLTGSQDNLTCMQSPQELLVLEGRRFQDL